MYSNKLPTSTKNLTNASRHFTETIFRKVAEDVIAWGCKVNAPRGDIIAKAASDLEEVFSFPPHLAVLIGEAMFVQYQHDACQHDRSLIKAARHEPA